MKPTKVETKGLLKGTRFPAVPLPGVGLPCCTATRGAVSVTRLSCFVDSLGPFVLLTCYHGGRFCRTDIVEDHKRLITINNYISQDWNDFNLAVRISSLRFSFGRDWNDKFQLRCSNDKFQLRCSNSTESDQSHARRPEDRTCHPVDRGRLRIPKHITNEMHEWVKTTTARGGASLLYHYMGWGFPAVPLPGVGLPCCTTTRGGASLLYHYQGWGFPAVPLHGVGLPCCTTTWGGASLLYHYQGWGFPAVPLHGVGLPCCTTTWGGASLLYHYQGWGFPAVPLPGVAFGIDRGHRI